MSTYVARLVSILLLCGVAMVSAETRITKEQLQEMFDSMRQKTKWNVDGPMLWGYFFTNKSRAPLKKAADDLSALGYRFVDLSKRTTKGEPVVWWLHVEKVETHSVETLHQRNRELTEFAKKWRLDSYDGMDVGPANN
jgi:ribosomal 50S subunit-associated protein YjgA (DUF615 family)